MDTFPRYLTKSNRHRVTPSTIELFETTLRDPMIYQLGKRYYSIFERYQAFLPPYTAEELGCPDVKIEHVDVDKLVTFFETVDTEITNAVYEKPFESKYYHFLYLMHESLRNRYLIA
jgi:hypothetical protein